MKTDYEGKKASDCWYICLVFTAKNEGKENTVSSGFLESRKSKRSLD